MNNESKVIVLDFRYNPKKEKKLDPVIIVQDDDYWYNKSALNVTYSKNKFILNCGCQTINITMDNIKDYLNDIKVLRNDASDLGEICQVIHAIDKKANISNAKYKETDGNYLISLSNKAYNIKDYKVSSISIPYVNKYIKLDTRDNLCINGYRLHQKITVDHIVHIINTINDFFINQSSNK